MILRSLIKGGRLSAGPRSCGEAKAKRQSRRADLVVARATATNRLNSCLELLNDANSSLIHSRHETRVFCSEVGEFSGRLMSSKAQRIRNLCLPLVYRQRMADNTTDSVAT